MHKRNMKPEVSVASLKIYMPAFLKWWPAPPGASAMLKKNPENHSEMVWNDKSQGGSTCVFEEAEIWR